MSTPSIYITFEHLVDVMLVIILPVQVIEIADSIGKSIFGYVDRDPRSVFYLDPVQ